MPKIHVTQFHLPFLIFFLWNNLTFYCLYHSPCLCLHVRLTVCILFVGIFLATLSAGYIVFPPIQQVSLNHLINLFVQKHWSIQNQSKWCLCEWVIESSWFIQNWFNWERNTATVRYNNAKDNKITCKIVSKMFVEYRNRLN